MSTLKLALLSIDESHTTAHYFEKAARQQGHTVERFRHLGTAREFSFFDLAIVVDPWLQDPEALAKLPCRTAAYLIDVHRTLDVRLSFSRYIDDIFIAQPAFLPDFERLPHGSVTWLPLACDPDIHFVPEQTREFDVGFVGKLGRPGSVRYETLSRVFSSFTCNDTSKYYLPHEMGRVYSASKIVINCSIGGDLNMRFFEALASGALVVTDDIGNGLHRMGGAGEHFVTYRTPEEAVAQIRHYLAHDVERERIAKQGQALAFSTSTYRNRLTTILDVATNSSHSAPARVAPRRVERRWRGRWYRSKGVKPSVALKFVAGGVAPGTFFNTVVGVARHLKRT